MLSCRDAVATERASFQVVAVQVIIVGDLNVSASQKDCHYLIKHEKCYNAEELALLSALTSRCGSQALH
jgi:hypothetical protein